MIAKLIKIASRLTLAGEIILRINATPETTKATTPTVRRFFLNPYPLKQYKPPIANIKIVNPTLLPIDMAGIPMAIALNNIKIPKIQANVEAIDKYNLSLDSSIGYTFDYIFQDALGRYITKVVPLPSSVSNSIFPR